MRSVPSAAQAQRSMDLSEEAKVAVLRGAFPGQGAADVAAVLHAWGGSLVEAHLLMQVNLDQARTRLLAFPTPRATWN